MVECLTGSILEGRYEVLSEVGRGKFGIVYKAKHKILDRPVAVKVLHEEVKPTDNAFLRFQREAETTSGLVHPNIVKIYDFGISEGRFPFVVMDFIDGTLLGAELREHHRLPAERALPIFVQICEGLQAAHDSGVVHRDLRPDNIFLIERNGKQDCVKIVDFGIAKKLNDTKSKKLTAEGEVLGTPTFMSPEQVMGKELDPRSDIYAMGCLMYNVLTGELPFLGKNVIETMSEQVSSEPRDFSDACAGLRLPVELQFVVKKALKKAPSDRYQSMNDLKEFLEAMI